MNRRIALIASLDTKLVETKYAQSVIRDGGCDGIIVDVSTKTVLDAGAAIGPKEILRRYGMTWEEFELLGKAQRIETMSNALISIVPRLYEEGLFDAVVSIGGGQNARMAAAAMKALPFGVPKIVASSLACGKRTMEQYVGNKDIMVVHTVADIYGLNVTDKTVIRNICYAAIGMLRSATPEPPDSRKKIAATMLGITTAGVEGVLELLPDAEFEKTCFHANGVGGRCMEALIETGSFDAILDMTLHEITCEFYGGYCAGATNRLMAAVRHRIPMVVVPGAMDMLDFFIDEEGNGLPADIDRRKKVFHNSSIVHTKIYKDEAVHLAEVLAERLNQSEAPVKLVLPDEGFCEAAAKGGPMYDPEVDRAFIETAKARIREGIQIIDVHGNINSAACQRAVAEALMDIV